MKIYKIEEIENIQNYILGGKSDFIVNEIEKDIHINFQVKRSSKDKEVYFVSYKTIEWKYIGFIRTYSLQGKESFYNIPIFFPVKESSNVTEDQIFKSILFRKLIIYIYFLNKLPDNISILYTGVCSVCSRKLTDPKYIRIGIGKICLEK